jgi:uncharacterized protein involved in exopolysaccharide biosynthesis
MPERTAASNRPLPGSTPAANAAQPPSVPLPLPSFNPDHDIHILDRLAVLYRYRRIATTVFVLSAAAMMIQGYSSIQMYRAQARLLIEDERSTAVPGVTPENYYEDPDLYYKTQYRILKGRELTRRVIRRLDLPRVPEFNGTAQPPATPVSMLRDFEQRLRRLVRLASDVDSQQEAPKADETPDESAL